MQLYKNILVAMDCSAVDAAIVEHIRLLALQNQARVTLLHVIHSHTLGQERALRRRADTALEPHLRTLADAGVAARVLMRSGEPEEEILKEIEADGYDLVAMATHGHDFLGDLLFGSVSRVIKHKIRIPLLLLAGGPRARKRR